MRYTYRIEAGPKRFRGREFALFVTAHEGRGLMDWSTAHFSKARSRATLQRRVARLFPEAVRVR